VNAQSFTDWHHYVIGDGVVPVDYLCPRRTTISFTRPVGADEPSADMPLGSPGPIYRWAISHLELGEYVCFLDDDNEFVPTFIERMLDALRQAPLAQIAVCALEDFRYSRPRQESESRRVSLYRIDNDPAPPMDGYPEDGRCDTSGFLARSKIAKKIGYPRILPNEDYYQDTEFIANIAKFGWVHVEDKLVLYGVGANLPPSRDRI